eukprot:TRINITY_DN558_c0_g3_i1.p1 TRINITY_DN558_c0_g3~~TRINITY_DN558_c0_g3_i1.p1  ORF type:complete len:482 (+),score=143.57 TRINITY_DN558_c0_g3_i1:81-1526(+)
MGSLGNISASMTHSSTMTLGANTTDDCLPDPSGEGEDGVDTGLVVMGTLLVIAASFVSCFGINLQKLAHNRNLQLELGNRKGSMCQWRWWLGIIFMILASCLDMAALPFVPLSRVAALGCTTMVANIVITPFFLKEDLTRHDLLGCVPIVVGTVLACLFGAGEEHEVSSDCLLQYFGAPLFNVYLALIMIVLAGSYYMIFCYRKLEQELQQRNLLDDPLESVWLHKNLEMMDFVDLPKYCVIVTRMGPQFYPSIHAMYAGVWGAQSVMFAKAVLKFLGNAIYGEGKSTGDSVLYLFIFLVPTGICLYNQMTYLNRSLQIYRDALFVLPVYQAFWVAAGILSGLFFYQEYREIRHLDAVMFAIGCLFAIAGLLVLSRRESTTPAIESPTRRGSQSFPSDRDGEGAKSKAGLLKDERGASSRVAHEMEEGGLERHETDFSPATPLSLKTPTRQPHSNGFSRATTESPVHDLDGSAAAYSRMGE